MALSLNGPFRDSALFDWLAEEDAPSSGRKVMMDRRKLSQRKKK